MKVNFTDGIEIVIDDEKLISWQQSSDKRFIMLAVTEESGYANYEIDLQEKVIKRDSKQNKTKADSHKGIRERIFGIKGKPDASAASGFYYVLEAENENAAAWNEVPAAKKSLATFHAALSLFSCDQVPPVVRPQGRTLI